MTRTGAVYASHDEADRADRAYYRSLTPEQRLDVLIELIATLGEELDEAAPRRSRLFRVIDFPPP